MAFIPNDPELPDADDATFEPDQPIDNPYSPFAVGDLLSYVTTEAGSDALAERGDVFVTGVTRMIEGVRATVVRDTVYDADGRWVEDTLDWYAQDMSGNVWYLGENSYSFEYDEDTGAFLGSAPDGSWEWGVDGASPGLIRPAASTVGDSYYQEFYEGEAEDAAQVLALDAEVSIDFGDFSDVVKTFDFSTSEPDAREFKYAAPGLGVILEEGLDADDVVEDVTALVGARSVGPAGGEADDVLLSDLEDGAAITPDEPEREDFEQGDASEDVTVTFLGGVDDLENAVGYYEYDVGTGEIGEGGVLFASTDRAQTGARRTVEVGAGQALGVFVISDAEAAGLDLADYRGGGLFLRNIASGSPANLSGGLSPVATDADGNLLPFTILHALDADDDGMNLLNAGGAAQATELENFSDDEDEEGDDDGDDDRVDFDDDAVLLGFEERMSTDPGFDGDYNDVVVAVSDDRLSAAAVAEIAGMFGSEVFAEGGRGDDAFAGGAFDDFLLGRGGDDRLSGRSGDDRLGGGRGEDVLKGGRGADVMAGGFGDDRLYGGGGDDVARVRGEAAGYAIEARSAGLLVVTDTDPSDGDFGVDRLWEVEALRFDDDVLLV